MYKILNSPWVYNLFQSIFGPGVNTKLTRLISNFIPYLEHSERILDIGCGPSSWLSRVGLSPIGLDICYSYIQRIASRGGKAILASADNLPFHSLCFDNVFSLGLLHHVPDVVAINIIREAIRVCKPGGFIILIDNCWPKKFYHRPLAYLLRRLDRGKYVRTQNEFINLFPNPILWDTQRFTYSYNGLEGIASWMVVREDGHRTDLSFINE